MNETQKTVSHEQSQMQLQGVYHCQGNSRARTLA